MATRKELSRRRDEEEVKMLVELVGANYNFLTGALSNAKMKPMVDAKWRSIALTINSLGHGAPFSLDKIKRKWINMTSKAKQDVAAYNKESSRTGGRQNPLSQPTDLQFKIASIIGAICTEGIPGTSCCDTRDNSSTMSLIPVSELSTPSTSKSLSPSIIVCDEKDDKITPPNKQHRAAAITEKRDAQADELLKVEKDIENAVVEISHHIEATNNILGNLVKEIQRTNKIFAAVFAPVS